MLQHMPHTATAFNSNTQSQSHYDTPQIHLSHLKKLQNTVDSKVKDRQNAADSAYCH